MSEPTKRVFVLGPLDGKHYRINCRLWGHHSATTIALEVCGTIYTPGRLYFHLWDNSIFDFRELVMSWEQWFYAKPSAVVPITGSTTMDIPLCTE